MVKIDWSGWWSLSTSKCCLYTSYITSYITSKGQYFCSGGLNKHNAKATGCQMLSCCCSRTAPRPFFDASEEIRVLQCGSKYFRTALVVINDFSHATAWVCGVSKCQIMSFTRSVCRGVVSADRYGIRFPSYVIMPRNHWRSITLVEFDILRRTAILLKSGSMPCSEMVCPRNFISVRINWHLSLQSFNCSRGLLEGSYE